MDKGSVHDGQNRCSPSPEYAIAVGDTVSDGVPGVGAGNIETPGAFDVYTFTASAGQNVFIDIQATDVAVGLHRLVVKDDTGTAVLTASLFSDSSVVLERGGSYTIEVGRLNNDGTGTYQFQILPQ